MTSGEPQTKGRKLSEQNRAIYTHCVTVYEAMMEEAEELPEGKVYEGFTTRLFRRLGLGVPHYSMVMTELKRMQCVHQLKRGGGSAPSIWLLLQPPSEEMFSALPDTTRHALGGRQVQLRFEQQIRDLTERMNNLERRLDAVAG